MPFIFHQKKQSIFDRKIQLQDDNHIYLRCPEKQPLTEELSSFHVSMNICKEHPFRNFQQPKDNENKSQGKIIQFEQLDTKVFRNQKVQKQKICRTRHVLKSPKQNTSQNLKLLINTKNDAKQSTQGEQSHPRYIFSPKFINQQTSSFKRPIYLSQQRLQYSKQQTTPGPGAYNTSLKNNSSSQLIYPNLAKTYPIPQKNSNQLLDYIKSLQNKVQKKISQRKFTLDCSYKNQSSSCFKTSVLAGQKKNDALLSMLFSNKENKSSKDNQSQTTCQSRLTQTKNKKQNFEDDQFIKVEQKTPSPCSYDPSTEVTIKQRTNKNKQSKVFISGSPKFSDTKKRQPFPGPGQYNHYWNQIQKGQSFDQNQNKRPNKFVQDQQNNKTYAFSSSIPRQLNFGMGQRGAQQLYYSPKTNMIDKLKQKQNKSTLSNQYYFGSSLQRFEKDDIEEQDPYKYCFAKTKLLEEDDKKIGVKITNSKAKRQLFTDVKPQNNTLSPLAYDSKSNTIQKKTQNILQKLQLQYKYNQQVLELRQKKQRMQKVLIQEKNKSIDLKTTDKPKKQLYPDSFKQYLISKKREQKKGISFGYNKDSLIYRAFKPKDEVDGYYETQPGWDVKSFNKQYGYEVYE